MYLDAEATLEEALESAYKRFKIKGIAPMECCRLVSYDSSEDNIQCSFTGKESQLVRDILAELPLSSELLLEICDEGADFEVYEPGGIQTKVYTVDVNSADIDGPVSVRVQKNITLRQYKQIIATKLNLKADNISVAVLKYSPYTQLLETDTAFIEEVCKAKRNYLYQHFLSNLISLFSGES